MPNRPQPSSTIIYFRNNIDVFPKNVKIKFEHIIIIFVNNNR